jgi:hypothetical protein
MLVTKTAQVVPASVTNSRNFVKSTEKKADVLRSEIEQYFDKNGYLSLS